MGIKKETGDEQDYDYDYDYEGRAVRRGSDLTHF